MEPEGSLPHSPEPATCRYPKPDQSSPCLLILLLKDPFQYYPSGTVWFTVLVTSRKILLDGE